jgi:DNA-directed RNA polymerase specialized sigma24 family protein
MPNLDRLSQTTQDQILLALYELAKAKVEELVPGCYCEEVVHELAAVWLERLRAGRWDLAREDWEDFVVEEIRNRRVEDTRARKRTLARDGLHLQVISDAPREWMSQDLKIEEERLREFLDRVRATLPPKCVRAHAMIRDDKMTYAQVAKKLRVSERRVHEYVKTVHQAFRAALPSVGMTAPKAPRGGRRKATTEVDASTRSGSESTLRVNALTRGDRRSTSDVKESTAAISASTRPGFESTTDVKASPRDDRESTPAVRASARGDFELTTHVNASTRDDFEPTRRDSESTRRDLESTRRDVESTRRGWESTLVVNESTSRDLESTRRDLEPTSGDLESTLRDFESTRGDFALTRDVDASPRDDDASTRAVCSAAQPVCDSTRGESQALSTLQDEARTVSDNNGSALSVASVV